jgi:hypothetical protein
MSTIEFPLAFATAGVVGLGGLALLMGAALSSLAELLALLPGRGCWAGGGGKPPARHAGRSGLRRLQAGALVATVLGWKEGSDALIQPSESRES